MSTESPTIQKSSRLSRSISPSWKFPSFSQKTKGRQEPKPPPSNKGLLTPESASLSGESQISQISRSSQSSGPLGLSPFKQTINRLRSSSNVGVVEKPLLKESDFKQIEDWVTGFDRYNQLVTTRISPQRAYPTEEFTKIAKVLTKNKYCGGQFLHGLPEAVLDLALLWCPAEPLKQRESHEPTWSWTAWEGAVNFPFDPTNCPDVLSLPRREGAWFKSEILHYFVGPPSAPYTVRREKKQSNLRIQYPPYFHAPQGSDASIDSNTLRFSALTISADDFIAEQLHYEGKEIPCSQLFNDKDQHCGVIMDYEEAVKSSSPTGRFEFVLVSRNLRREPASRTQRPSVPTVHTSGTPIWDGKSFIWGHEVVDYDEKIFESGPWKMLNVILIKWVGTQYAERVAVARIHEDAWLQRCPKDARKKEIILR